MTTGEIWSVWSDHPELASAVDFIAAHVLPYWEGVSENAAVDQAIGIYDQLRRAYPGKRIVIAEFGWPSAGYNFRNANPGPHRAGRGAARLRRARRGLWHRLQHHRSLDQPWKIARRRRRPLLGPVRRLAPAEVLLDRADRRSRSLEAGRPRASARRAAVAADPARSARATVWPGCHCWPRPPMWSAPGSRSCSPTGTAIISCRARPSRSGFGTAAADPAGR